MEFEEDYTKPSVKYQDTQYLIDLEKKKIMRDYKNQTHDTIEAVLIFNRNVGYYKAKHELTPFLKRRDKILTELKSSFPKLNEDVVTKSLRKHGVYSKNFIANSLVTIFVIINTVLLNVLLLFAFTVVVSIVITVLTFIISLFIVGGVLNYLERK